MLKVRTQKKESGIHGIGLYADQFIPAGTTTWEYVDWFDISFSEKDLAQMNEHARDQVLFYAYLDKNTNRFVLCSDDYRFINHSNDGSKINLLTTPDRDIALRDINPGEELLCNYNHFDDLYFKRRGIKPEELL